MPTCLMFVVVGNRTGEWGGNYQRLSSFCRGNRVLFIVFDSMLLFLRCFFLVIVKDTRGLK